MNAFVRPHVGMVIGDPNGIGPEIVVKAWTGGAVHAVSRPVLIGSAAAIDLAIETCQVKAKTRVVGSPDEAGDNLDVIDIIDRGDFDPKAMAPGTSNAASGAATCAWLDQAASMAKDGALGAFVFAPIDTASIRQAGLIGRVIEDRPGRIYALLVTGALRVAHLTDHMLLRDVCEIISADLVESALVTLDTALRRWGIPNPRIVVAGLNPHAQGPEEEKAIGPGTIRAQQRGINAVGPVSPDAVFRQCIEGRYDVVLAIYHDQGHIPVKTWGFAGNCTIVLGRPHIEVTVAHGTAHELVGKNIADPSMMISATVTAASLAAGRGFQV